MKATPMTPATRDASLELVARQLERLATRLEYDRPVGPGELRRLARELRACTTESYTARLRRELHETVEHTLEDAAQRTLHLRTR